MANLERQRISQLDAHVITSNQVPRTVAIFCHGFGAPGDDLVPVGAQILQQFPQLLDESVFVFPEAPLSLFDQGISNGRAWWPLDLDRLSRGLDGRDFEQMRKDLPDHLPAARTMLLGLIEEVLQRYQLPISKIVLGGFSQGAMLSTDVALQLEQPPGGLVVWSGALLNEEEWSARAGRLKGVPVIQSHGTADPIVAPRSADWLQELLTSSGADMNFIGFEGSHTIPMAAITATGTLLTRLAQFENS